MYTAKGRLDLDSMLKQYSPLVRRLAHQMIADTLAEPVRELLAKAPPR